MQETGSIWKSPDDGLEGLAMEPRKIQCPACKVVLTIPAGSGARVARCGHCKERFVIPPEEKVTDDLVAGWLGDTSEDDDTPSPPPKGIGQPADSAPHADPAAGHQRTIAAATTPDSPIRLVSCDPAGALLEFSPQRLTDRTFRAAMPRVCMQCGARTHLEAHVVIFSGVLVDSVSLEAEHAAGKLVLHPDEIKDLSAEQVLDKLPHVPNVPSPADLPMPYWLCDMCETSKSVSGQIQLNSQTGEGWCRVFIRNLRRAEEFLCAVGARGTRTHKELARHAAALTDNPWDSLPLVVQHRLEQWFKCTGDEGFLAYVPDRDHARTEDGMFGLAVSNRRLTQHSPLRHRQHDVAQQLELMLAAGKVKGDFVVTFPEWKASMKVDADGITRLRRGLTLGKFQVNWR